MEPPKTVLQAKHQHHQPRITTQTPEQLKKIGYGPRTMIGFWNVRTLVEEGAQTHQISRFLQLENLFTQYGLSILGVSETRWAAAAFTKAQTLFSRVSLRAQIQVRELV